MSTIGRHATVQTTYPDVVNISDIDAESDAESVTERDDDSDDNWDNPDDPNSVNFIHNQQGLPDYNILLPEDLHVPEHEDRARQHVPEPKQKDISIQTVTVEAKLENNLEKHVSLARYIAINIQMAGSSIVNPIFNIPPSWLGKRKGARKESGRTKKAKLNASA
ncbi:hypothetical protein JOM56_000674 [Amanita muscaria]